MKTTKFLSVVTLMCILLGSSFSMKANDQQPEAPSIQDIFISKGITPARAFGFFAGTSIGLGIFQLLSGEIMLAHWGAQPLDPEQYKYIHDMVKELADILGIEKPKLLLAETFISGAFTTYHSRNGISVMISKGVLEILNERELRAVFAHELAHIKNKDLLKRYATGTVFTTLGYISPLSQVFVMPAFYKLIRQQEYAADETGAHACGDPESLASALKKIYAHTQLPHTNLLPKEDDTFVVSIYKRMSRIGNWFASWLESHPECDDRVENLQEVARKIKGLSHTKTVTEVAPTTSTAH